MRCWFFFLENSLGPGMCEKYAECAGRILVMFLRQSAPSADEGISREAAKKMKNPDKV